MAGSVGTLSAAVVVNSDGAVAGMRTAAGAVQSGTAKMSSSFQQLKNQTAAYRGIVEERIGMGGWNPARMRVDEEGGGGGGGLGIKGLKKFGRAASAVGVGGLVGDAMNLASLGAAFGPAAAAIAGLAFTVKMFHDEAARAGEEAAKLVEGTRKYGVSIGEMDLLQKAAGKNTDIMEGLAIGIERLSWAGGKAEGGLKHFQDVLGNADMTAEQQAYKLILAYEQSRVDSGEVSSWMPQLGTNYKDAKAWAARQQQLQKSAGLFASGAKMEESLKTPLEKYQTAMSEIGDIFRQGGFSSDTMYQRAMNKAKGEYMGATQPEFAPLAMAGSQEAYSATVGWQFGQQGADQLETMKSIDSGIGELVAIAKEKTKDVRYNQIGEVVDY
jgi:hypothetical protein